MKVQLKITRREHVRLVLIYKYNSVKTAAKALKVNYSTLNSVLAGQRRSTAVLDALSKTFGPSIVRVFND